MKVTSHGDSLRYLKYGEHILDNQEFNELIIMGSGASIETAVKVAE